MNVHQQSLLTAGKQRAGVIMVMITGSTPSCPWRHLPVLCSLTGTASRKGSPGPALCAPPGCGVTVVMGSWEGWEAQERGSLGPRRHYVAVLGCELSETAESGVLSHRAPRRTVFATAEHVYLRHRGFWGTPASPWIWQGTWVQAVWPDLLDAGSEWQTPGHVACGTAVTLPAPCPSPWPMHCPPPWGAALAV